MRCRCRRTSPGWLVVCLRNKLVYLGRADCYLPRLLRLAGADRRSLLRMAASSSLAREGGRTALLMAADGLSNEEIARRSGVDWTRYDIGVRDFDEKGVDGVGVTARSRSPHCHGTRDRSAAPRPVETRRGAPWSTRTLARQLGIGKDAVARIWADHNLKPWKLETFKISNDPRFEEKLVDVVGLYMNPPDRAAVFSFDEKPQVQLGQNSAQPPTPSWTCRHDDPRLQAPRAPPTCSPHST